MSCDVDFLNNHDFELWDKLFLVFLQRSGDAAFALKKADSAFAARMKHLRTAKWRGESLYD